MTIAYCSGCARKVNVPLTALDQRISCPYCKQVTTASPQPPVQPQSVQPGAGPTLRPEQRQAPRSPGGEIIIRCSHCVELISIPPASLGKQVRCPRCQQTTAAMVGVSRDALAAPPQTSSTAAVQRPEAQPLHGKSWWGGRIAGYPVWLLGAAALLLAAGVSVVIATWGSGPEADQPQAGHTGQAPLAQQVGQTLPSPQVNLPTPTPAPVKEAWFPAVNPDLPWVVIQVGSFSNLLADLSVIAAEIEQSAMYEKAVADLKAQHPQQKATLLGLDPSKPMAIYFRQGKSKDGTGWVLAIPVENEQHILAVLRGLNLAVQQHQEGSCTITLPPGASGKDLTLRFAYEYAYVSDKAAAVAAATLVPPAKLFPNPVTTAFTATLHIDRIPIEERKRFLEPSTQALAMYRSMMPLQLGEKLWQDGGTGQAEKPLLQPLAVPEMDKATKAYFDTLIELGAEYFHDLANGGGQLSFGLAIDHTRSTFVADLSLTGRANSRLAANIASVGAEPSMFGGMLKQEAALKCLVHMKMPQALQKAMPPLVAELTRKTLMKAENPLEGQAFAPLMYTLGRTFASGEADIALALTANGPDQPGTSIVRVKAVEGRALGKAFIDKMKELPAQERKFWAFNEAQTAGMDVVRHDAHLVADPLYHTLYGPNPNYYAFEDRAFAVATGVGGKDRIEEAFSVTPQPAPIFVLDMNLKEMAQLPFLPVPERNSINQILTARNPGRVHLQIEGGRSLRTHLDLDLKLLPLIVSKVALTAPPK